MQDTKRREGFTLIELLVVVAIIAVLISILLPALKRAKEQGRISVCLNDLHNIGGAATMYMTDSSNNDDLPWVVPFNYSSPEAPPPGGYYGKGMRCISEFVWGGGMPEDKPWPAGFGMLGPKACDINYISPKYRPMNRYMSNQVSWERRGDIPGFFKCPGDSSPAVPDQANPEKDTEGDTPFQTWAYWGSSYPINWYWPYYYAGLTNGGDQGFLRHLGANSQLPGSGRQMLKGRNKGTWGAEFVIFYENRMNYAMAVARPRGQNNPNAITGFRGWHGDYDMFSACFVDGHAAYKKFDSRYVTGLGYTTWPTKPWDGFWKQYNDKP